MALFQNKEIQKLFRFFSFRRLFVQDERLQELADTFLKRQERKLLNHSLPSGSAHL